MVAIPIFCGHSAEEHRAGLLPFGLAGLAGAGGLAAAGAAGAGMAGAGLPAMSMGGFNGVMNVGSPFSGGQTTPAYNFVPSWLTGNWNIPTTTALPNNEDNANIPDNKGNNGNNGTSSSPTPDPSQPSSGSGGTWGPGEFDAAWNGGDGSGGGQTGNGEGSGHSGGGG